jgi:pre-mRNA-processing factor SLU7
MSSISLSKDEYKARKTLEEAQKRGVVSITSSDPRAGTSFTVNTPWLKGTTRRQPTEMPSIVKGKQAASINDWYQRGVPEAAVYKYRSGACENCGAMTHARNDCLERPRKVGAKFSGSDFKGDEQIKHLEFSYEGKKDLWNGYNPDRYQEVIDEYNLMNEKIEEKHAQTGSDVNEEFKEKMMNRQYLDPTFDPKTKSSFGLRQKGDKAKYLENLDDDAPEYDPKTRALNLNPNPDRDPNEMMFKGDSFHKFTGDTLDFISQDRFAWDHVKKYGSELNSVAMPTLTELLHKKAQAQTTLQRGKKFEEIAKRYGGANHFTERIEDLIASKDNYVEYDEMGKIINHNLSQKQGKSKYPEDIYPQDHTSVWGSWWNKELGWGFACCHGTDRNAICPGDKGKKLAIIKEYRFVKKREAELKYAEKTEDISKYLHETNRRIEEIEKIIDEQQIHINLESHKAYEKHLAEQNQKKIEDEKNQKFQKSVRDTDHENKYVHRERSRSNEKTTGKFKK